MPTEPKSDLLPVKPGINHVTLRDIIDMVKDPTLRVDLWTRQVDRERQTIRSYGDLFQLFNDLLLMADHTPLNDRAVTQRLKLMCDTAKLAMDAWKSYLDTEHVVKLQQQFDQHKADLDSLIAILRKRLDPDLLEEIREEWERGRQSQRS